MHKVYAVTRDGKAVLWSKHKGPSTANAAAASIPLEGGLVGAIVRNADGEVTTRRAAWRLERFARNGAAHKVEWFAFLEDAVAAARSYTNLAGWRYRVISPEDAVAWTEAPHGRH